MENPRPVNLMTDDEMRERGWAAVARDSNGHLISSHAPFTSKGEMGKYLADEYARGLTITKL